MPGIITSSTTRSGKRSRASCQASSPSEASMTSSLGCSIDRRWRATSSNMVGSSSATSTTAGAACAFTIAMIEELVCFGQVLSSRWTLDRVDCSSTSGASPLPRAARACGLGRCKPAPSRRSGVRTRSVQARSLAPLGRADSVGASPLPRAAGSLAPLGPHSPRNAVGTRDVDSTSSFDAVTYFTSVGMCPFVTFSLFCIIALVGSSSRRMTSFQRA